MGAGAGDGAHLRGAYPAAGAGGRPCRRLPLRPVRRLAPTAAGRPRRRGLFRHPVRAARPRGDPPGRQRGRAGRGRLRHVGQRPGDGVPGAGAAPQAHPADPEAAHEGVPRRRGALCGAGGARLGRGRGHRGGSTPAPGAGVRDPGRARRRRGDRPHAEPARGHAHEPAAAGRGLSRPPGELPPVLPPYRAESRRQRADAGQGGRRPRCLLALPARGVRRAGRLGRAVDAPAAAGALPPGAVPGRPARDHHHDRLSLGLQRHGPFQPGLQSALRQVAQGGGRAG